jgi:dissimilatory sulfite reductase (desulfoviridin) alpha/beta subunit
MAEEGVIEGRLRERVVLRVRAREPYCSELTSEQVGLIADIAEKYGAGLVHVSPRQTVEIPHVERAYLGEIRALLESHGLSLGSTGRYLRNVIACSRWCLYNAVPMSDCAQRLNRLLGGRVLPAKTTISLSGCDFSCVRSRTSDIGVIARAEIELTDKRCKLCSLCVKEPLGCQVDAIELTDDGVAIDAERCVRCGFCSNVCRPGTIRVRARGFDVLLGGRGGLRPREAVPYRRVSTEEELVQLIGAVLLRYSALAKEGERIGDVLERLGVGEFEV